MPRPPILALALVLSFASGVYAAAPTLEYVFPAGGQRGTTVTLNLGGKFEPWPMKVWSASPALQFKVETNKNTLTVQVAPDAPLGPQLFRVYNDEGASEPKCFVIGAHAEIADKEPNDDAHKAQAVEKLPVVVNGKLDKGGDVDSFAVELEAGRWFIAQLDAYSLGSPVDAFLRLENSNGVDVASAHDTFNLDPLLVYHVGQSGTYVVQVAGFVHPPQAEVRFTGSASTIYRLTLTDGPYAGHAFPPGAQRGKPAAVQLHGWNLNGTNRVASAILDAARTTSDEPVISFTAPPAENAVPLALGDFTEVNEVEPNDTTNQAQTVTAPCVVNGVIALPGDEDRFRFGAKKGEAFEFRGLDASLHSPLEIALRVEDALGKPLARSDTSKVGNDARLAWTAPETGSFTLVVADLYRLGSDAHVYRAQIGPSVPDFLAAAAEDTFTIEAGKTNNLKMTVTRLGGHTNKLVLAAQSLPPGITVKDLEVPAKGGEVTLTMIAAENAAPVTQPLRFIVRETGAEPARQHFVKADLKGKEPRGDMLINDTEWLWLTVRPKPAPPAPKP